VEDEAAGIRDYLEDFGRSLRQRHPVFDVLSLLFCSAPPA
jgi:hypothetical protein